MEDVVLLLATYFETTLEYRGWRAIRTRGNIDIEVIRRTSHDVASKRSRLRCLTRYEIELLVLGVENKRGVNWAEIPDIREKVSTSLQNSGMAFGVAPPAYNCPKCDQASSFLLLIDSE